MDLFFQPSEPTSVMEISITAAAISLFSAMQTTAGIVRAMAVYQSHHTDTFSNVTYSDQA